MLTSRNGNDLTARFPTVAKGVEQAVKTPDCVLDGEVCALDENGRASFSAMQQGKPGTPLVLYVFDLLEIDGEPVIDLPLTERRARLERLLDKRNRTVRFSESFDDGDLHALRPVGRAGRAEPRHLGDDQRLRHRLARHGVLFQAVRDRKIFVRWR